MKLSRVIALTHNNFSYPIKKSLNANTAACPNLAPIGFVDGNYTYYGFCDNGGGRWEIIWNNVTGQFVGQYVISALNKESDTHAAPAGRKTADGGALYNWALHEESTVFFFRKRTTAADPSTFAAEYSISVTDADAGGSGTTYGATFIHAPTGNIIHLGRCDKAYATFAKSTDHGATFTGATYGAVTLTGAKKFFHSQAGAGDLKIAFGAEWTSNADILRCFIFPEIGAADNTPTWIVDLNVVTGEITSNGSSLGVIGTDVVESGSCTVVHQPGTGFCSETACIIPGAAGFLSKKIAVANAFDVTWVWNYVISGSEQNAANWGHTTLPIKQGRRTIGSAVWQPGLTATPELLLTWIESDQYVVGRWVRGANPSDNFTKAQEYLRGGSDVGQQPILYSTPPDNADSRMPFRYIDATAVGDFDSYDGTHYLTRVKSFRP